jgi:hypothetical protein
MNTTDRARCDSVIAFRVTADVRAALERAARRDLCSMSDVIRQAMLERLRAAGLLDEALYERVVEHSADLPPQNGEPVRCAECGRACEPRTNSSRRARSDTRYCSSKCRQKAYRKRITGQRLVSA